MYDTVTVRRKASKGQRPRVLLACALLIGGVALLHPSDAASQASPNMLAAPESFAGIADPQKRSAAIFTELGKVLTHPRCVNCHRPSDHPRQTDQERDAPAAGPARRGRVLVVEPLRCSTACHGPNEF